jgi:acetyl-CoA acetyltransferase
MSQIQSHAEAALNAMADTGLKPADIDGIATAGETLVTVAHYLGLTPKWVDGTAVGGCSFMIHVRHAAAAIAAGLCETVLITHGESGRSGVGRTRSVVSPASLAGQFEQPYGPMGPPVLFTIPVLRYMIFFVAPTKAGVQGRVAGPWSPGFPLARERQNKRMSNWQWSRSCSANRRRRTRATLKTPITIEDVLNSLMIANPFRLLQCCLVTDGGGAVILVAAERARDFSQKLAPGLNRGRSTCSALARASTPQWSVRPSFPRKAGIQGRKGLSHPPGPRFRGG